MNILQIMGCTSDQYASMERYLVAKASFLKNNDHQLIVVYENVPKSKQFFEDLKNSGGRLLKFKFNGISNIKDYIEFYRILRDNKIDIVHTYFNPTGFLAAFVARISGINRIYRTAANLPLTLNKDKNSIKRAWFKISRRLAAKYLFDKILCRSRGVYEEYLDIGIEPERLQITDGGTDVAFYSPDRDRRKDFRKLFKCRDDYIVICAIGRLVEIKGFDILIKALARIETKNIIVLIAGEGPERTNLESLVYDLNLGKKVKFIGHTEDIVSLLNASDLFISSSYAEGMSNSILEAMACGLPIIITNISSNKDFLQEIKNIGLAVHPADPDALADSIAFLMERADIEELGKNARNVVVNNFTIDHRIKKECQIYKI